MKEFGKKIGTLGLIMSIAFSVAACSIDISSLTDDDDAVDMIYRTDAEDVEERLCPLSESAILIILPRNLVRKIALIPVDVAHGTILFLHEMDVGG